MNEGPTTESPLIHRLRNHLAVVVSFAELLLLDIPDGDPKRADIAEIKKAAFAAMALMPEVAALGRDEK